MTDQQFDQHDETTGHAAMLARIRVEQLANQPEPAHKPSWVDDYVMCQRAPIRHWCCDWHEHQPDHDPYRNTESGTTWDGRPTETVATWCCEWHARNANA